MCVVCSVFGFGCMHLFFFRFFVISFFFISPRRLSLRDLKNTTERNICLNTYCVCLVVLLLIAAIDNKPTADYTLSYSFIVWPQSEKKNNRHSVVCPFVKILHKNKSLLRKSTTTEHWPMGLCKFNRIDRNIYVLHAHNKLYPLRNVYWTHQVELCSLHAVFP